MISKKREYLKDVDCSQRKLLWLATVVSSVLVESYDTRKDYADIVRSKEITGDIAEMRRLSVHEDYRRLGIAEKLVSGLKDSSKNADIMRS